MAKFSYWTGVRFWTTSNSQFVNPWFAGFTSALRLPSDTYVRSIWAAQCTYSSDASSPVPGWWQAANVYFAADFDATATQTHPHTLLSTETSDRLAIAGMTPDRYSEPEFAPSYGVVWRTSPPTVNTSGRRKGSGLSMPRVTYGVQAADQNAFFTGVAEPTLIIRCSIWGRILWESDSP